MDVFLNAIIFQVGLSVYDCLSQYLNEYHTHTLLCGIADACIQKSTQSTVCSLQSLQLAQCHYLD